ncbi:carboxypeptidase regulatory-like domain-containing protein, partial [Candidatus Pacearchaeota archaeon]|nr:carboxypeptidase regulatory-like domain-containing protein [Candidatus Pacearchaeota archaeon]
GKVRIRFFAASGLSSATLRIAQLIVAYAIASRTVGYVDGAVWIDTNVSNTSTELFVSGTADNPVSTLAAATTIADALGLKRFEITSRSMLTLTQAYVGYRFTGPFATIDLNGQDVDGAVFSGLIISGDDAGSNATPTHYNDCTLLGNTLGLHHLVHCIIEDAMIVSEPGDVHWFHCSSGIAGIGMPSFDFGASIADTAFSVRDYSGGLEIRNLGQAPTDTMSYEGVGQLQLAASCVGGTIAVRGNIELTDNSGDAVTLSDDARVTVSSIEAGASAANTITITVHDALAAIVPGITVDIYDSSNTALVRRATDDDDNGIVLVNLDDGTYKIRISGLGFQPDNNPETLVVTTDASVTYTGVQFSAPVAANPALCTVYGFATDASGNTKDGETISFLGEGPIGVSGNQITAHRIDVVTGPTATNPAWASGYFEIDLIRLSTVRLKSPKLQFDNLVITVPDLATQQLTVLTEAAK